MRCGSCGRDLPEGAQFCAYCGTRVPGLQPAAELVKLASTSGPARTSLTADVPDLPQPAEVAPEAPEIAEPPEVPEPASLPGESRSDLSMLPMPTPVVPSSAQVREMVERRRREAAELLTEGVEREITQRVQVPSSPESATPDGLPKGEMTGEEYADGHAIPPPPSPPASLEGRPEHVAMGQRSLTASMVGPRQRRPVRGHLPADSLQARSAEEAAGADEPTGARCCTYGCITLAIVLALSILGMLWLVSATHEPKPPPAARAPTTIERMIAQVEGTAMTAHEGPRGMTLYAQQRPHTHSPSRADGRMSDDVLHELRQADAR